jgi:hypothetical protein
MQIRQRPLAGWARQLLTLGVAAAGRRLELSWRRGGPARASAGLPSVLDEPALANQDPGVTAERIAAWMGTLLVEVSEDAG